MAFFLITPAIGWAWPALVPIVGAVAAALGYKHFAEPKGRLRGATSEALDKVRLERVPLVAAVTDRLREPIEHDVTNLLHRRERRLLEGALLRAAGRLLLRRRQHVPRAGARLPSRITRYFRFPAIFHISNVTCRHATNGRSHGAGRRSDVPPGNDGADDAR